MYKLGIDVGGTNTDAVLLDSRNQVLTSAKRPTTTDVEGGITAALDAVLGTGSVRPGDIQYVMLGTTHATNAVIERKRLARIAVIRACLPAGRAVEPMFTWPDDLRQAVSASWYMVHGGVEFDGRPLHRAGLDEAECRAVLREVRASGAEALAICAIYSPVRADHERTIAQWAAEELGADFPVTLSAEIGSLGLLERENSACLNAALIQVARTAARGLLEALRSRGIAAEVFFAQNDGTLMSLDFATRYPILTIASGPTNSIRGASYLTSLTDCIVVDVGGTSTDLGVLIKGFPRESAVAVEIGGVRTNFRMPDILSIGLGGGSIVREHPDGRITIGPDSVGYELTRRALAWAGDTLTATDVLLAAGMVTIDDGACDPARVAHLPAHLVSGVLAEIRRVVEDAIDKMKTSQAPVPVVLVGGGSILVPESLAGTSQVIRPKNFGCANAIGAAIAQVSGQVDRMWDLDRVTRAEAVAEAKAAATGMAVEAGADAGTVGILDVEEVPLAYLPSNALRIKVKAAGNLAAAGSPV